MKIGPREQPTRITLEDLAVCDHFSFIFLLYFLSVLVSRWIVPYVTITCG